MSSILVPSINPGGMTLLSTTSLSGTSVTVSSIPQTYNQLFIEVYGVTWNTGESALSFSTNITGNTDWTRILSGYTPDQVGPTTDISPINSRAQNPKRTGGNNYHTLTIYNYSSTTDYKTWRLYGNFEGNDFGPGQIMFYNGGFAQDTAVNSITFKTSSNYTMTGGALKIYGVK